MLLALLLACASPSEDSAAAPARTRCVPELTVAPPALDFGQVPVGTSRTAAVTITNTGDCLATLRSAAWAEPDAGDGLTVAFTEPVPVGTGASVEVPVTFAPTIAGGVENVLDLGVPGGIVTVPVSAIGMRTGDLTLAPAALTLDAVEVGCVSVGEVSLRNEGQAPIEVSGVALNGGGGLVELDLTVDGADPLPWTILPGAGRLVVVLYRPVDLGLVSATLSVSSDDLDEPELAAAITATPAVWPETQVLEWTFDDGPVDVLVAVDTSAEMRAQGHLEDIDAAWAGVVAELLTDSLDYQLGVVGEDGCVDGGPVTSADAADDQVAALRAQVPPDGVATATAGFTALLAATDATALARGGCNEGLLRPGARLAVVGVTSHAETSGVAYDDVATELGARLTDPEDLLAFAAAGDWPSGCANAEAGSGWYELVETTGGTFTSICGDHLLAALPTALLALPATRYELTGFPADGTILVYVDGVLWPFTYDSGDNVVELGEAPPPGSTVTIEWLPSDYCED